MRPNERWKLHYFRSGAAAVVVDQITKDYGFGVLRAEVAGGVTLSFVHPFRSHFAFSCIRRFASVFLRPVGFSPWLLFALAPLGHLASWPPRFREANGDWFTGQEEDQWRQSRGFRAARDL